MNRSNILLAILCSIFSSNISFGDTFPVDDGGGGGGSVTLDDITEINCVAGTASITAATSGVYRIPSTSTCIGNDTISIGDVGSIIVGKAVSQSIVNDSGFDLQIDASANTGGIVNEATSNVVPAGSTFSVLQTAASTVHIIGTGTGGANSIDQIIPAQSQTLNLRADVTDPDVFSLGTGVQLAPISVNLEPDPVIGWFYNKTGVGGVVQNQFEHGWHHRAEGNFKHATATSGDNFVEFNQDVHPPDNESNVTGQSAGFSAAVDVGDTVTFGSGATAWVLAWNDPLLEFRMDAGGSPAALDSISLEGETATLGAVVTPLGQTVGHQFRPYIQIWSVKENDTWFTWRNDPDPALPSVLRVRNNSLGINWIGQVGGLKGTGAALNVQNVAGETTAPLAVFLNTTAGYDGGGGSRNGLSHFRFERDYTGTNTDWGIASSLLFSTPVGPLGTGSSVNQPRIITIEDQQGYENGGDGPIIVIDAQTCAQGGAPAACATGVRGNFAMRGGGPVNGHIILGGFGSDGLHLYKDVTNNTLEFRPNHDPTNDDSGFSFVSATGRDSDGPSIWAVSEAAFSNGNEVCSYSGGGVEPGRGGTCVGVIEFGNSTTEALVISLCTDEVTTGDTFLAMCK